MFSAHFNRRDKAALLALYADDALLTVDGTAMARGKAEIERMLTPFLEGPLKITIKCVSCHQQGDTALVRSDWKFSGPDGAVETAGSSAEVLRREADGLWRYILDDATFASRPSAI
jgi:uncharacterized protein (TIGR02246 family)